ncbi:MAG TPA: RidA family protein [Mycobacterium sp.]|nr:RidA family protein [Mycobacterium sp.]
MSKSPEDKVRELGLEIPDYTDGSYHGLNYGSMKAYHRLGTALYLSGHVPDIPGREDPPIHAGKLGADVTIEEGYEAARITAINCLATMRLAVGSLDNVKCLVNSLNFVVSAPDFVDVNKVSSGATDLFKEVFGDAAGLGGRATIGVTSLAHNHCFENWMVVETVDSL